MITDLLLDAVRPFVGAVPGAVVGVVRPSVPLTPDAWIEQFAALPLVDQPGTV